MDLRDRYRTGTPFLAVADASAAIDFYRDAFDAAVRQLEDHARKLRGDVKSRAS